ncbi:hypothetical protein L1987_86695 [Smallanthus sonchifolius]|uniref:Uncharacterized protein n=1 Tax=Smallanthus sonchifolius TaxID=185202 RepID=A0ACB8Y487_9ASTR|nr:hypothetical protein L1987_86695 [Smallanthus sonchifolius]
MGWWRSWLAHSACTSSCATYFAAVSADAFKLLASLAVVTDKLVMSTSCSLLHTAVDIVKETELDDEIISWRISRLMMLLMLQKGPPEE